MRFLTTDEIDQMYEELFENVFGDKPLGQIPRTVMVHEIDGEIKGFVSGYLIDRTTFYLSWGGVVDKFVNHIKFWNKGLTHLRLAKVRWVQTNVENTNVEAQKLLLKLGFIVYGLKATQGKLFVEYQKEL